MIGQSAFQLDNFNRPRRVRSAGLAEEAEYRHNYRN